MLIRRFGSIALTYVVTVRPDAQKPLAHQPLQHYLAHHPLDATQTLHLLGCQSQSGHFQKLGAEPPEHVLNRSHNTVQFTQR